MRFSAFSRGPGSDPATEGASADASAYLAVLDSEPSVRGDLRFGFRNGLPHPRARGRANRARPGTRRNLEATKAPRNPRPVIAKPAKISRCGGARMDSTLAASFAISWT